MKHAEEVTFAAGGLDRAAHLRTDQAALEALWAKGSVVALWRGKPLVQLAKALSEDALPEGALTGGALTGGCRLVKLRSSDPLVEGQFAQALFLGLDTSEEDARGLFAVEVADWPELATQEAPEGGFFDPSLQHHPAAAPDQVFAELRGVMTQLTRLDAELAATARAIFAWHDSHKFCAKCGAASIMVDAGWRRHCPSCGASHFPRTDPVVIMLITRGDRVLLGRSPGWPEGMYSLLAGFVEPGETLEAAVRREVLEEAGVPVGPVRYLASQPWAFPMSLMIGCAGEALGDEIVLDPAELEDAIWLTRQEAMDSLAGEHPSVRPARRGSVAHFLLQSWLADRLS